MAEMRIHQIARELGMDAPTLVGILRYMGYRIESYANALDETEARKAMEKIRWLREEEPPGTEPPADAEPHAGVKRSDRVLFCLRCGKKFGIFRGRHLCAVCGAVCCSSCRRTVPESPADICVPVYVHPERTDICEACYDGVVTPVEDRMQAARADATQVETWPASFRGVLPVDTSQAVFPIDSRGYRQKDEALESLRLTAAFLGCDMVYEVRYARESRKELTSGSVAEYTVWRASGIAGKKQA